jgi:Ras-related protein Rab-2A
MGTKESFDTILDLLVRSVEGVQAAAIVDRDGLIMTSKFRGTQSDDDTIGAVTAVLDNLIARIKTDFGSSESFLNILTVDNNKFLFASAGNSAILTVVADLTVNENALQVYAAHIAKKVELILQGSDVDLTIPLIVEALAKMRKGKLPKGTYNTKVIVLGDPGVGKTSLIRRFVDNKFQDSYISTIGVDITKKRFTLDENTIIDFVIWDIGGQIQHMAPHRKRFYGGVNFCLLEFDISRRDTFLHLDEWLKDLKGTVEKSIPMVLIANKTDKPIAEHQVSLDEVKAKAAELGGHWLYTSAKTGSNVDEAFRYCAIEFLQNL